MEIEALPSFELTFEGYCQAVTAYVLTDHPYIIQWIGVVNQMLASGELVWEPARTIEERHNRIQMIANTASALRYWSRKMEQYHRGDIE